MRQRVLASLGVLAGLIAAVSLATVAVAGQTATPSSASANTYIPPRTVDGQPDLQGIWDFRTITPLERPNDQSKALLTDEEAAEFEAQGVESRNVDLNRQRGTEADVGRAYNDFWWDRGTKTVPTKRTSLVIDPPDGKVPALTPEAQKRTASEAAARARPAIA